MIAIQPTMKKAPVTMRYDENTGPLVEIDKLSQANATPKAQQTQRNPTLKESKSSMFDMKHKLQDIQHNKNYLEKKIHEYEKKLNDLRGGCP